jgi:hypothetical protein
MKRKLLFSITKKDFDIQTFKAGGYNWERITKISNKLKAE